MAYRKNKFTQNIDMFRKIVADSNSIRDVQTKLGYKESGGIYKYLRRAFLDYEIDISHFTGQTWNKGKTRENDSRVDKASKNLEVDWDVAFSYGSSIGNAALLKRIIVSGKREYCCEDCKLSSWHGKPIRLQLDHVNGDNLDNRESNLKILCPNCHSQTDTFSRGIKPVREATCWWKKYSLCSRG